MAKEYNIIVLDTETTGLEADKDRLVELAAVDALNPSKHFTTLVNPQRSIPPEARAVHHISPAEVENAPTESEAFRMLLDTMVNPSNPTIFVAHNAKFDRGFITRIAPAFEAYWICTYKSAMMLVPDAPAFTNQVLRYFLELEVETPPDLFPHRALYDTIVTAAIFNHFRNLGTVNQMAQWTANPIVLPRVTFGKHKGLTWDKVPFGYLKWIVGQSDMDEDVVHTANHYMRRG